MNRDLSMVRERARPRSGGERSKQREQQCQRSEAGRCLAQGGACVARVEQTGAVAGDEVRGEGRAGLEGLVYHVEEFGFILSNGFEQGSELI